MIDGAIHCLRDEEVELGGRKGEVVCWILTPVTRCDGRRFLPTFQYSSFPFQRSNNFHILLTEISKELEYMPDCTVERRGMARHK